MLVAAGRTWKDDLCRHGEAIQGFLFWKRRDTMTLGDATANDDEKAICVPLGRLKAAQQPNGIGQRAARGFSRRERERVEEPRGILLFANPVELRAPPEFDVSTFLVGGAAVEPESDIGTIGLVPSKGRHRQIIECRAAQDWNRIRSPAQGHSQFRRRVELLSCRSWQAVRRGVEHAAGDH
jgi:hypothetical protein